jgi:hypothetical protein
MGRLGAMEAEALPGRHLLIEIGVNYVQTACPEVSSADVNRLSQVLTDYVQGMRGYDESRTIFMDLLNREDPLARIRDIIQLPDDPLPYHPDCMADDEAALTMRRRTRTWTNAEDLRLLGGIARFGLDNWQAVAHYLGSGRNRAQCSQRWSRGLNPRICNRPWSPEEEHKLCDLVKQFGEKSWAKVAAILGNRSDVQCRYHYRQMNGESDEEDKERKDRKTRSGDFSPTSSTSGMFLTLTQSRKYQSSPQMLVGRIAPVRDLVLPLAPVIDRRRLESQVSAVRTLPASAKWGICGADRRSLDSFLLQFTT